MKKYTAKTENIVKAARNIESEHIPLYEHGIGAGIMEKIMNQEYGPLMYGSYDDKKEWIRRVADFYETMGYDFFNFEMGIGGCLPGGGALGSHVDPVIKDMEDFQKYPWEQLPNLYFEKFGDYYRALREAKPSHIQALAGPGNGVFECVQDLVGYEGLCYIKADDEELYGLLFRKVGETIHEVWKRFIALYGDLFCAFRIGDDLGFKSATLLPPEDIKKYIVPEYKAVIETIHTTEKPFIYHSCGQIFDVMDAIITEAKIDAKHSNEDQIAPFWVWVEKYGDQIGNFGGIDTDAVCRLDKATMRDYIEEVAAKSKGHGGFAFGSGNSIPDYVPVENYIAMNEIIREIRGEKSI